MNRAPIDSEIPPGLPPPTAPAPSVVITGAGLICSLGLDVESSWRGVLEGRCGFGELTAVESTIPPRTTGGQAPPIPDEQWPLDPSGARLPREAAYLRLAIIEAMKSAGIVLGVTHERSRAGLMLGTTLHGMRQAGAHYRTGDWEFFRSFMAADTMRLAAGGLGFEGSGASTSSACSSGLSSIILGVNLLIAGELDVVIAGGYDPMSEYTYAGFNSLRLVATDLPRPFCVGRQGMRLGEGYGLVVLEREGDAAARGTKVWARVAGWGETSDAFHLTQPHPQGQGAAEAMRMAIERSGEGTRVGLVVAHATSTPDNDAAEAAALGRVLDGKLASTAVVAFKSRIGHTLGGAGSVELVLSMMAMRDQVAPGTHNLIEEKLEFPGLNVRNGARPTTIEATLNQSMGFGGSNASMVLKRAVVGAKPAKTNAQALGSGEEIWITGVGVVLPEAIGNEAFVAHLQNPATTLPVDDQMTISDETIAPYLNAKRIRRMSPYVKYTLASATMAATHAGLDPATGLASRSSGMLGSAHGASGFSEVYYRQIVAEGLDAANPMLFAEGVSNAGAAHLSMGLNIKGPCQAIIGSRTAGLDAMRLAAIRIRQGESDRILVSAGEETIPLVEELYRRLGKGQHCPLPAADKPGSLFGNPVGFRVGSGAISFVLESASSARMRGASCLAVVESWGAARVDGGMVHADGAATGIEAVHRVLQKLGTMEAVVSSANTTALDLIELGGLREYAREKTARMLVGAVYGHVREMFSVTPMASVAAMVLLKGRLPRLMGTPSLGVKLGAANDERVTRVGVIGTEFAGCVAGIGLRVG